jgi:hypothetical protein
MPENGISGGFGVSEDSVYRSLKKFLEHGGEGFFGADGRKGRAHKICGSRRERIQAKLDKGQSVNSIAKEEGVRESATRYLLRGLTGRRTIWPTCLMKLKQLFPAQTYDSFTKLPHIHYTRSKEF